MKEITSKNISQFFTFPRFSNIKLRILFFFLKVHKQTSPSLYLIPKFFRSLSILFQVKAK